MAYVASNDQHGNEIMRVMLSTEPGKRTVASCQNLRINCSPARTQPDTRPGRYDHRHRFHYFADTTPSQRQDVRLLQEQHIDHHQQQRERQQQEKLGLEKQQPDRVQKKRVQQEKTQGQTQKKEQLQPEMSQSEKQPQPQRLQLERSHSEKKALSEKSQPKMQSQPELQSQLVKSHLSKSQPENNSRLASSQPETHLEKSHLKKSHLKVCLEKEYLEKEYLEKAYIENSYTEKTYSEKLQPEKLQPVKLQPEKSHAEKSHAEKSPVEKTYLEKSQPEKSHVEKTYLEKLQPKKTQLEKSQWESCKLENSLPEKPQSAKLKPEKTQPAKKSQPGKARSQMLYSEMNLEPDKKSQAVKLKPEKSQPDMPKPEKSQPVRSLADRSHLDKSLPDKLHLDKSLAEKKTQAEKSHSPKLQAEMSQPDKKSQPEKHPQAEKKSHPEISQPEILPPEGKTQPEYLPPPKRAQPVTLQIQTKESVSVEELALWNSTEVIAHSTLLSTGESQDRIYKRGNSANASSKSPDSPFYAWLAAKNELQQQLAMDRRLYSELEQQRAVERARLAQLKYERWIQAKTNQMRRAKSDLSSAQTTAKSRQSLPADEAQRRLLDWEREKRAELKAQRLEREAFLARQNLIDSTRRELSAEAWEQWVYATRNRPKPVAMGRGLDSLRASNAPHYRNPNEWQTLLPTARTGQQGQQQPTQATAQVRSGPDYERLERLAQPRRKLWRQTFNEPVRLTTKECGVPAKTTTATFGSGGGGEHNRDTERLRLSDAASQTQPEDAEMTLLEKSRRADATTDSCLLRPQRSPIIWSKSNAQRVREMRKVVQPSECGQGPRQLRDDQLEQLRKQQDMQNSKILPRKFQQKREQLRKKLKAWVEEGKALPERSLSDSCRNLKDELKQELRQELKQQQRRAVYVDEAANTQRHNARKMSLTETRIQRSEEQLQSIARKSIAPLQRARSTEPKRLLMGKEAKEAQKSKPWR